MASLGSGGMVWQRRPPEANVCLGDDTLFVIDNGTVYHGADYHNELCMGGLHCLKLQDENDDDTAHCCPKDESGWSWYGTNYYNYTSKRWFWSCDPQMLPLSPDGITAHALHPAGRAFFVSVNYYRLDDHRGRGTFSYDTKNGYWTRHGDWKLRAWVGLHIQIDGNRGFMPDGHICACDVPDVNGLAAPEWKLGKEKLFLEDPERHVDAKLVDMGGGGRFCLVEIVTMPGVDREGCIGDGDKCVLRLTVFRVEHDDDGELTATDRRPARSFRVSKYKDYAHIFSDYWQAFWA